MRIEIQMSDLNDEASAIPQEVGSIYHIQRPNQIRSGHDECRFHRCAIKRYDKGLILMTVSFNRHCQTLIRRKWTEFRMQIDHTNKHAHSS